MRAGLAGNSRYKWVVVPSTGPRSSYRSVGLALRDLRPLARPGQLAEHQGGAQALEPGREHLLTVRATIIGLASDWRRLVPDVIDQYGLDILMNGTGISNDRSTLPGPVHMIERDTGRIGSVTCHRPVPRSVQVWLSRQVREERNE